MDIISLMHELESREKLQGYFHNKVIRKPFLLFYMLFEYLLKISLFCVIHDKIEVILFNEV